MKIVLTLASIMMAVATAVPVQSEVCGRSESGSKVHPDCTKFYVCNNGFTSELACPPTLYFNGVTCDYPVNVPECVGGTRFPSTSEEEGEEASQEEPTPVDPIPEVPAPVDPVPEQPTPVEPIGDGQCPNAPYYYLANPSNSNTFFICKAGKPSGSGKCGEGLVFNQTNQYCA